MNGMLCLFLDTGVPWWQVIIVGTVATAIASLWLASLSRRWGREDREQAKEQAQLKTGFTELNLKLESEIERRRADIAAESHDRRDKDDDLGCDISDIREVISHDFGERSKERPIWREKK